MHADIKQVLSYHGLACYTDAYVIGQQDEIYLLSLFGSPSRVQAIKAAVISGDSVYCQEVGNLAWDNRRRAHRYTGKMQVLNRKLAPDVAHALLYAPAVLTPEPEDAADCKVFCGTEAEVKEKFFYAAQKHYATPLLPQWTAWLWEEMAVEPLEVLGFKHAYQVKFIDQSVLERRLFEYGAPLYRAVG